MWGSEVRGDVLKEKVGDVGPPGGGLGLVQVSFKSWLCHVATRRPWASCITSLASGLHLLQELNGTVHRMFD